MYIHIYIYTRYFVGNSCWCPRQRDSASISNFSPRFLFENISKHDFFRGAEAEVRLLCVKSCMLRLLAMEIRSCQGGKSLLPNGELGPSISIHPEFPNSCPKIAGK